MAGLPLYDPAGTRLTDRQQANAVNADMFGGAAARALSSVGEQVAGFGDDMMRRANIEKERNAVSDIADVQAEGVARMRHALYDEGGIYSRTGKNADGMTDLAMSTADTIFQDVSKKLKDPRAQEAFKRSWQRYSESIGNAAAAKEMDQRAATRTASKTALLQQITNDVIANYNDEEVLATNFATAAEFIAANPDGLPPEVVSQLQRETASSLHLAVIQRLALDDPGRALSYYERHKGGVSGVDHTKANQMISGVSQMRDARQAAEEIANTGTAGDIIRSVIGPESGGDPSAVSPVGAAGLMQLMPETARGVAASLGMSKIAAMTDDQLKAYWVTPEGRRANVRLGTTYLNKQLTRFGGDLEAALIAYNAGPDNAVKFLNAGRDYAALPKASETLPYVQRVLTGYLGKDVTGQTSADIQRMLKGGQDRTVSFSGDARGFLLTKLQKQHGPASIDEMSPMLQQRLAAMFSEAPDFVKAGLDILSGARSHARQVELWNASDKTGHSVARPGHSKHENRGAGGEAADLGWQGKEFSTAPKEVREWIHANAARYGLTFPMGWEPWHIETKEARGGKGARPVASDPASQRVAQAFTASQAESGVRVAVDNSFVSPADVYTRTATPFQVSSNIGSLDSWLQQAREQYAGNPSLLAEVERQLTDEHKMRGAQQTAQLDAASLEIFKGIVQEGKKVRDYEPGVLAALGQERVNKLLETETKWNRDDDVTDEETYYRLSKMTPEELAKYDLRQDIDKLSKTDFKTWADRIAQYQRPNASAAKRETDLTRTQITGMAENMLGLNPTKEPDDAKRMALLQRAFNSKIDAFIETSKREPNGTEMQAMMDELLLSGEVKTTVYSGIIPWTSTREVAAFEMTPDEKQRVTVADSFTDIPLEAHGEIARGYRNIWQVEPNEETAVDFYNDMARVKFGGAPLPPPALDAKIRQGLAVSWGRPPTQEEVAGFYREWIIRATAK